MKRLFMAACLALSLFQAASAQNKVRSPFVWDVEMVSATIIRDSIEVMLRYILIDDRVDRGAYVTLSPSLKWIDKEYRMTPLSVCGYDLKSAPKRGIVTMTGKSGRKIEVRSRVPYDPGMTHLSVSVRLSESRGDKESKGERRQVAVFSRKKRPDLNLTTYFIEPPAMETRERREVIPLNLNYSSETDAELNLDDRRNYDAYDRFLASCSCIILDARTRVSSVVMSSYTSIKGSESENRKIAAARLKNVSTCLTRQRIFGKKKVTTGTTGEDWKGVKEWLAASMWSDDHAVRALVSGNESADRKETRLKAEYPDIWNSMNAGLFPSLMRMECVMTYSMLELNGLDELLDAYRTNPKFLEPKEFYQLLSAFEPMSYGWNEVLIKCAQIWPESQQANINAASLLLRMGKVHEAGAYLRKCHDSHDARYMRAAQMLALGNTEAAEALLKDLPHTRDEFRQALSIIENRKEWENSDTPWDIQLYRMGQTW